MQPIKTLLNPPYCSSSTLCTSHNFCNNGTISETCCQRHLKEKQAIWSHIRLSLNVLFVIEKMVPKGSPIQLKVECPGCRT